MQNQSAIERALKTPPRLHTVSFAVHGLSLASESFRLADLWMLHFYDYHGELTIDGREFPIHPGSVSIAPADALVSFTYQGPSRHLYCHFALSAPPEIEPIFVKADPRLAALRSRLESCINLRAASPTHASARLWDILFGIMQVVNFPHPKNSQEHILRTALDQVEHQLSGALRVTDLARACGISVNTLERVFQKRIGKSPVAYIQSRRIDRALELLRGSDMPVKAVAHTVGMPDLQHFNKSVRRATGRSPRAWRTQS